MNPLEDLGRKPSSVMPRPVQEEARLKLQTMSSVPIRQSAREKAAAATKAKKLRDKAEAASALEDFVKDFDADIQEDNDTHQQPRHSEIHSTGSGLRPGRRHFSSTVGPCVGELIF